MLAEIGFVLATLAVVVLVGRVSGWLRLPDATLLTAVGLLYALLPGPNLRLEPDFVLDVLLPPLLYHAALGASLLALRARLRSVVSLSVALVLATALAVGGLLSWLVPIVPLAAAVAIGAAVAPPDPVAALSIGRRAGLPAKLTTLIEGEGLLNDATALTIYQVAVAVAVGGGFSLGRAFGVFALATAGGLATGAFVALLVRLSRRVFTDPLSINAISLGTPFVAYLLGELTHGSGVLAVVVAGLINGYQNPRLQSGASRLQTTAVWRLVDYLLEGFVFLLIGQQLPTVLAGLRAYPTGTIAATAGITVGVVVLLRPLWLFGTQHLPRRLHARLGGEGEQPGPARPDRALTGPETLALSWAGTRGVITLAAAFAIPASTATGAPFPARAPLLFAAYLVVLVTLLGQGLTFGPLLGRLELGIDERGQARLRNEARTAAVDAALARLDQLVEERDTPAATARQLRASLLARKQRYRTRLESLAEASPSGSAAYENAARARRAIIDAQHEELLRWRDAGRLPEASLRLLQTELDHQERTLPAPPR